MSINDVLPLWPKRHDDISLAECSITAQGVLTNDEVDLRSEGEDQVCVAHKIGQLELLNDAHLSNILQCVSQFL